MPTFGERTVYDSLGACLVQVDVGCLMGSEPGGMLFGCTERYLCC